MTAARTHRRSRNRHPVARASRPWAPRAGKQGNPQTMQYDAADRLTTMQSGGTATTFQWGLRGVMARQYQAGAPVATYSYTDINNNLRVAQDAAGLTTSTYDGDNLRRRVVSSSGTTTMVWDGADYLQIKPSSGDATLLVVLEGEVVGHVKGSEKRDYIVDPLGSVVAYLNSSQALTDQFEYWPYGELIAEIEAGTEPFLWVGSLGYFRENDLRTYIRARTYRQDLGSWMQLDPLWPGESPFAYPHSPVVRVDPTGLKQVLEPCSDSDLIDCPWDRNPISNVGYLFIDCNCKGVAIGVLPEDGDIDWSPPCGQWIKADAIVIGKRPLQRVFKIHGGTCAHFSCPPDDDKGCYQPGFKHVWSTCLRQIVPRPVEPTPIQDFCREFCGRPCPPKCRGYG